MAHVDVYAITRMRAHDRPGLRIATSETIGGASTNASTTSM